MIISRPSARRLCLDQYKMTLRYITFIFTKNYINLLFLRHRGISSCPNTCWWSYQGSLGRVEDGHQEPQAGATCRPGNFLRRPLLLGVFFTVLIFWIYAGRTIKRLFVIKIVCFVKYIPCLRLWVQSYLQCRALSHWEEPSPLRQKTWKSMSGTSHQKKYEEMIFLYLSNSNCYSPREEFWSPRVNDGVILELNQHLWNSEYLYFTMTKNLRLRWSIRMVNPPAMRGERDFPDSLSSFLVLFVHNIIWITAHWAGQ